MTRRTPGTPWTGTLRLGLACCLFPIGLLTSQSFCLAQESSPVTYTSKQVFRIPFEMEPGAGRLREVQLFLSRDQGATWNNVGSATPDQGGFRFRAERDGMYWFTVRTIDIQGRANPLSIQGSPPQQRVVVDTQVPVVSLRQRPAADGMFGVEWDARDENLDPASLTLEYRAIGGPEWIPLSVDPVASGERIFSPRVGGPVEVHLRVRDLAKNEGEARLTLNPGSQDYRYAGNPTEPERSGARTLPGTKYVNSSTIKLNYEMKSVGPSGVSVVELWVTRDGRDWQVYSKDEKAKAAGQNTFTLEVKGEGIYGFTLVGRSGVGYGKQPPRVNDPPQVWVEVDLTKPQVHWVNADVGRGPNSGKVAVTWKATDKNLGREPITLSYAKDPQGPWTPIATNLENTGRYDWTLAADVPYKFILRVEATDKAGNVGSAETVRPVIVDLSEPESSVLSVEPGNKQNPPHD